MSRTPIVSLSPFGLGHVKPHHYWEMAKVFWENRDNLRYAWRILRHGVCDGCSLGPYGLRDNTMKGVHLCMTRLKLLRLNTMGPLDLTGFADAEGGQIAALRRMSSMDLRKLGRLAYPMIRRRGDPGFTRISWDEALDIAAGYLRRAAPDRLAFYTTSRGLTNEVYYVAQKLARLLGTNNIDNASRLCHAASTTALKQVLGVAASTCSYEDWIGTDLVVLFGTHMANNQPVAIKYLYLAKKEGTRIVVVNPYKEPGLERYWIPSVPKSALFGTRLMDDYFQVTVGGDIAFCNGVLKHLIERSLIDRDFIDAHTAGFDEVAETVARQPWTMLEERAGVSAEEMRRFADIYGQAGQAVFIWSMGLTQHRFGVENVKAVANLALARGMLGRKKCGLVPIRGHSGVQGAAECGSVPSSYPGGLPVNAENARTMERHWGHDVPSSPGLVAPEMIEAAHRGEIDAFYIIGGNFVETLPEPFFVREALERVHCRIHQDIVLNSSMLAEPREVVLLLPGQTRYEQRGGGTTTSTERRIRFTPEIPGHRVGEARAEWEILVRVGERALPPEKREAIRFADAQAIRGEMEAVMPLYKGVGSLNGEGESVQYGGPILLRDGVCPNMPDGRACFTSLDPPDTRLAEGQFYLTTRRGKQFNSILFATRDPLTGSRRRDEIFLAPDDAEALGVKEGDPLRVRSAVGEMHGLCKVAPVRRRTVQAHWPEANVLISRRLDPGSGEPDYNAVVTVEKVL